MEMQVDLKPLPEAEAMSFADVVALLEAFRRDGGGGFVTITRGGVPPKAFNEAASALADEIGRLRLEASLAEKRRRLLMMVTFNLGAASQWMIGFIDHRWRRRDLKLLHARFDLMIKDIARADGPPAPPGSFEEFRRETDALRTKVGQDSEARLDNLRAKVVANADARLTVVAARLQGITTEIVALNDEITTLRGWFRDAQDDGR